ncbi:MULTISPECIES: hypothetical protein [unclassified Helicobacter]|uniref:hypothetical protein n=1 Tax=unclassified Helicobacter TaxID=2593540 RepID=UPI000CF0194F|nr:MULTISPECIES: hypothetical protein [unclassified Helicobacter]
MIKVISSYIFFFFLVFAMLGIMVSETSHTFSQLFFLLCKDGLAYDFLIKTLYFLIAISGIVYLIYSNLRGNTNLQKLFFASLISIIFLFIGIFSITSADKSFIDTLHFKPYDIVYLDFFSLFEAKGFEIIVSIFFYFFFTFFPLGFLLFNLCFNLQKPLHSFGYKFFPSLNICILFIIVNAMQPYYDKLNFYFYIDLFLFLVSLIFLLVLFIKKKYLFGFYEYANLLFLMLVIFIILLCSSVLVRAEYYNMRYCFSLLVFLFWCCEWMFEDLLRKD